MAKEFEYSFTVESADAFHPFCVALHPNTTTVVQMRRRVFKDGSDTIARVTEESDKSTSRQYFDFKEDTPDSQLVKHVEEAKEMNVLPDTIPAVEQLLAGLSYEVSVDLIKQRTRYMFDVIHIDIDEYSSPYSAVVIEVEGDVERAKTVYELMQKNIPDAMKKDQ